jgi:GNAT superfamily N-acetyltransferase
MSKENNALDEELLPPAEQIKRNQESLLAPPVAEPVAEPVVIPSIKPEIKLDAEVTPLAEQVAQNEVEVTGEPALLPPAQQIQQNQNEIENPKPDEASVLPQRIQAFDPEKPDYFIQDYIKNLESGEEIYKAHKANPKLKWGVKQSIAMKDYMDSPESSEEGAILNAVKGVGEFLLKGVKGGVELTSDLFTPAEDAGITAKEKYSKVLGDVATIGDVVAGVPLEFYQLASKIRDGGIQLADDLGIGIDPNNGTFTFTPKTKTEKLINFMTRNDIDADRAIVNSKAPSNLGKILYYAGEAPTDSGQQSYAQLLRPLLASYLVPSVKQRMIDNPDLTEGEATQQWIKASDTWGTKPLQDLAAQIPAEKENIAAAAMLALPQASTFGVALGGAGILGKGLMEMGRLAEIEALLPKAQAMTDTARTAATGGTFVVDAEGNITAAQTKTSGPRTKEQIREDFNNAEQMHADNLDRIDADNFERSSGKTIRLGPFNIPKPYVWVGAASDGANAAAEKLKELATTGAFATAIPATTGIIGAYRNRDNGITGMAGGLLRGIEYGAAGELLGYGALKTAGKVSGVLSDVGKVSAGLQGSAGNAFKIAGNIPTSTDLTQRLFGGKVGNITAPTANWFANNLSQFAYQGVEAGSLAAAMGILDSVPSQELPAEIASGMAMVIVPHILSSAIHESPAAREKRLSQENASINQVKQQASPESLKNAANISDYRNVVNQQKQIVDDRIMDYRRMSVDTKAKPEDLQKAEDLVKAEDEKLTQIMSANSQTRREYGRQNDLMWSNLQRGLNGPLRSGQENVGVEILTKDQILQKLIEKNKEYASTPQGLANLEHIASQDGFVINSAGGVELRAGDDLAEALKTTPIMFDPSKTTAIINADASMRNSAFRGAGMVEQVGHEGGHLYARTKEFQEANRKLLSEMFSTNTYNEDGSVAYEDAGYFTNQQMKDLLWNSYLKNRSDAEKKDWLASKGLWDRKNDKFIDRAALGYYREEIIADMASNVMKSRTMGSADGYLLKWAAINHSNNILARAIQGVLGVGGNNPFESGFVSGAEFTQEMLTQTDRAMRQVEDYYGHIAPVIDAEPAVSITDKDMMKSKGLLKKYGITSGMFETSVFGIVRNGRGEVVAKVPLANPATSEGTWVMDKATGRPKQVKGYDRLPDELDSIPVPDGGTLEVSREVAMQPDGETPILLSASEQKKGQKARRDAILNALGITEVPENGVTWRGTFTPEQVENIKRLPEYIVPKAIKDVILQMNESLARGDGTRWIIDYSPTSGKKGKRKSLTMKPYDVVPISMHITKDGNFNITAISATRIFNKIHAWGAEFPHILDMWGGSKSAFFNEFTTKYLKNWQEGKAGATGLDPDPRIAEMKRDIFNNFLNLKDKDTDIMNQNRFYLKKQKGDLGPEGRDRTIMSIRADHISSMIQSSAQKIPVDYYKAKINAMPESGLPYQERPEDAPVREPSPAQEERRPTPFDGITAAYNSQGRAFGARYAPAQLEGETKDDYVNRVMSARENPYTPDTSYTPLAGSQYDYMEGSSRAGANDISFMPARTEQEYPTSERGFYSGLQKTIDEKMPAKASPQQILSIVNNPQNAKAEEVKWSNLAGFVEGKTSVTKQEVLDYLRNEGSVKFEEVTLGGNTINRNKEAIARDIAREVAEDEVKYSEFVDPDGVDNYAELTPEQRLQNALQVGMNDFLEEAQERIDRQEMSSPTGETKYSQYVTPNGENYREVVLTMPNQRDASDKAFDERIKELINEHTAIIRFGEENTPEEQAKMDQLEQEIDRLKAQQKTSLQDFKNSKYTSSHFQDIPNYVAHMRLNERSDSEGRNGLFIEELQSDRHQAGRKQGYKEPVDKKAEEEYRKKVGDIWDNLDPDAQKLISRDKFIQNAIDSQRMDEDINKIPDAPFRKDWPVQMFKRALRDAIDSNKDWVGWTSGETQNARYPERPEEKRKGMAKWYNETVPNEINRYVKKWGAKVEEGDIKTNPNEYDTTPIWKIDITPEMRSSIKEGGQIAFMPKSEAREEERTERLPASGAELTASLVASGTSLESFGKDTLIQLAEYYGIELPKGAKRGEIIDAINERPTTEEPIKAGASDISFIPAAGESKPVPTQEELDAMKARLPKYRAQVIQATKNKDRFKINIRDDKNEVVGFGTGAYDQTENRLNIEQTMVYPDYRKKGYGEALYREIAKHAQSVGADALYGQEVSDSAERVREKLFPTTLERGEREDEKAMESAIQRDISFMPSSKLDEAHAKAIESGDMEEAQRLVDERAREAGYDVYDPVYHSTSQDFNAFDNSRLGTATMSGTASWGHWFGQVPEHLEDAYGGKAKGPFYLKKGRTTDISYDTWQNLSDYGNRYDAQKFYDNRLGSYDTVKVEIPDEWNYMEEPSTLYAVKNPNNIKSADPATYDKEGKLIPLSQRFDTSKPDIRFMPESKEPEEKESLRLKMSKEALTDAALNQSSWKNWYKEHKDTIDDFFGDHAKLFQDILGVTSQASSVKANVGLALKAFGQLMRGEDFTGYLPAVVKNLNAIRDNTDVSGRKISNYKAANEGDVERVVVDRHIARLLFGADTPSKAQYDKAELILTEIANELGWEPSQVQAALWAHSIVQSGKIPQSYGDYLKKLESTGGIIQRIGGTTYSGGRTPESSGGRGRYSPAGEGKAGGEGIAFLPYSPELPKTEDGKIDWEGFKTKTLEIAKPLAGLSPIGGVSFMPAQNIEMKPSDDGRTITYQHDKKTTIKPPVKGIKTLIGEIVGMLEADRHNTLGDNMGGPMHPFLLSNQVIARLLDGRGFKPVWANMNSAFVTRAKNVIKNTTSGRALIQIMKEEAHISNRKFVTDVMSELDKKKASMPKEIVDSLHVILELGARNPATKLKEVTAAQKAFKKGEITQRELNKVIKDNQEAIDKYGPMVAFLAKLGSIKSKATKGNIAAFNKAYGEHIKNYQKADWYKSIADKYRNTKFADEAARFTFNQRGAAMKRLRGIAYAPDITKMLADSMDFKGGKNLDLVASVQLSKDPNAFAIYTGKDPKQEAKMSKEERYLRDQFMKNPKFKKHPSYDWMMLGPEKADNFILEKPVDPLVLFPDYAKKHPNANVRNGSKETIVGTMKKSKIPLKIK